MAEIKLAAKKREKSNKGAVKALRREERVPGVLYSRHHEPVSFSVEEKAIKPLVFTTESHLINLEIESGENLQAIIKDVQFDPVTDRIVHFDLHGIKLGEKIEVEIPLLFVGQPEGVRAGGNLRHNLHKILVSCLPKHLPSHLEVDISGLQTSQSIHVGDLSFENMEIITASNAMVCSVTKSRGEETETEDEETTAAAATTEE